MYYTLSVIVLIAVSALPPLKSWRSPSPPVLQPWGALTAHYCRSVQFPGHCASVSPNLTPDSLKSKSPRKSQSMSRMVPAVTLQHAAPPSEPHSGQSSWFHSSLPSRKETGSPELAAGGGGWREEAEGGNRDPWGLRARACVCVCVCVCIPGALQGLG